MLPHRLPRPLVILPRAQNELHLVPLPQMRNVRVKIASALAARRRLQIHDPVHPRIDRGNVMGPARFQQHRQSSVAQHLQQRDASRLHQRLAPRDLDQRTPERLHLPQDFLQLHLLPLIKGILRVAIRAAQIAKSQPHKHAGQPRPGALALHRLVDFVDRDFLHLRQS